MLFRSRPELTSTVVDDQTDYDAGEIVYDESATGDCYLANDDAAPGDDLTDAKWTRQVIPSPLWEPLVRWVNAERLATLAQTERSQSAQMQAAEWVDMEMLRQPPRDGGGPPWAYNAAGNYYDLVRL